MSTGRIRFVLGSHELPLRSFFFDLFSEGLVEYTATGTTGKEARKQGEGGCLAHRCFSDDLEVASVTKGQERKLKSESVHDGLLLLSCWTAGRPAFSGISRWHR